VDEKTFTVVLIGHEPTQVRNVILSATLSYYRTHLRINWARSARTLRSPAVDSQNETFLNRSSLPLGDVNFYVTSFWKLAII
jgi:hypothetical protein